MTTSKLSPRAQALIDAANNKGLLTGEIDGILGSEPTSVDVAAPLPVTLEPPVPTIPAVAPPYTPEAMVDLILASPGQPYLWYAQHFGQGKLWFTQVLASDAYQSALNGKRHLIADPYLTATMEERFRFLTMQAIEGLSTKLEGKEVSDLIVTKAAEIGVKALGMGQKAPEAVPALPAPSGAEAVASRIMQAMADAELRSKGAGAIEAEFTEVKGGGNV